MIEKSNLIWIQCKLSINSYNKHTKWRGSQSHIHSTISTGLQSFFFLYKKITSLLYLIRLNIYSIPTATFCFTFLNHLQDLNHFYFNG